MRLLTVKVTAITSFFKSPVGRHQKPNRGIKIHVYAKRKTSDSNWEFLRIENKQIKTVQNNSYV